MERAVGYGAPLTTSFSMVSLAEGSEVISEVDEIKEVKLLIRKGNRHFKIQEYLEALTQYNEALEIDYENAIALASRAATYLELGNYLSAEQDAETLIAMNTSNSQGYYLKGLAMKHLNQSKDALTLFLKALDLDPKHADQLSSHIAVVAVNFCNVPDERIDDLKGMDAYKKLSEVGVYLNQANKFNLCIKILETAQRFKTNQKGITMKLLLTLANAHCALKHRERAIALYQDCHKTAVATHDPLYQIKTLVNIATLYLEDRQTELAIIHYEKLLHLHAELVTEYGSENIPDIWTTELDCGLRLNLSIAYKAVGDLHKALTYAEEYIELLELNEIGGRVQGESHHHQGMLLEMQGNYSQALVCYERYLAHSKNCGDKKGVAQAYGCLGSIYGFLKNWKLSMTYHDQYISLAQKFDDSKMLSVSYEMKGDTLMMQEDYPAAVFAFDAMINASIRTDYRSKATGLCKLGNAHRAQKQHQYSIYFYQQSLELADDFDYEDVKALCQYNLACIWQHSTQMNDIDLARKYFVQLISLLEGKIVQHREEATFCPAAYAQQLLECYDGIQSILAQLGNKEECLQYAEAHRKQKILSNSSLATVDIQCILEYKSSPSVDMWSIEKIHHVVSQQNATVLYYSILDNKLLLWVLQPGLGIVRFYASRATEENSAPNKIQSLLDELSESYDWGSLQYETENRALPLKNADLIQIQKHNLLKLSSTPRQQSPYSPSTPHEQSLRSQSNRNIKTDVDSFSKTPTPELSKSKIENVKKSAYKQLYNILLAPVEDVLATIEGHGQLLIIPDKLLHRCPFNLLQDWNSKCLYERFKVTLLPCLLVLEKSLVAEWNQLRQQDQLDFDRSQSRKGGINKFLNQRSISKSPDIYLSSLSSEELSSYGPEPINPRSTSNPRLITSRNSPRTSSKGKRENAVYALSSTVQCQSNLPSLTTIPEVPRSKSLKTYKRVGSPTRPEKAVSKHTYSTLTTQTATGTDIITSNRQITHFAQISNTEKCFVIGDPDLSEGMFLHERNIGSMYDLPSARRELIAVASYLDVDPVLGKEATKERFMQDITTATVVHIASYGCWNEGYLAFSPNPTRLEPGPPGEEAFVIKMEEIAALKLSAQLVVLSSGFSPYQQDCMRSNFQLPATFLNAGAQCVLACLWTVPNNVLEKFYFHFYSAIQNGNLLTDALNLATTALKEDNRYQSAFFWSTFVLIGRNVSVNIKSIRHSMLDQAIDKTESELETVSGIEFLNPKQEVFNILSRDELLAKLQVTLRDLLTSHREAPSVVLSLIDLYDSALKRLHTEEHNRKSDRLSDHVINSSGSIELLKVTGFHFQAKGAHLNQPCVVYPHWNQDQLLVPTYDALRAIIDISAVRSCAPALCQLLPMAQDTLSQLIDVFSITKHAIDVQLKVTDLSVRPLWYNDQIKRMMSATGFYQIGVILNFNRVPQNRHLLTAVLQFLLAVSMNKSQVLLYRLDASLLGNPSATKSINIGREVIKLPTLTPLVLPRNQLRMTTPWFSVVEKPDEMREKIKLAKSKSDLAEEYKNHIQRANSWHQMSIVAQANEELDKVGRPEMIPKRVKVISGASASRPRILMDQKPILRLEETDQRRDYAHYVIDQRINTIGEKHKSEVLKLYLPYIET